MSQDWQAMLFMQWKIVYYETSNGSSPIYDFIENLAPKVQAKIANTFSLLETYGTRMGSPHTKKLVGTPLWELRVLGQDSIRIFYVACRNRTFVLLHGFLKKKQKTDPKEIKTTLQRLKELSTD